ncbi:helix-turn-helix domain-containing protein [Oligoflexia bacterium]|nr:helix-turn-helix domain-containing protein [Oligoflexia bacterium]
MKTFKKLSKSERNRIYKMLRLSYSFRAIARELGRNHSTIIREVSRNAEAVDKHEDYC